MQEDSHAGDDDFSESQNAAKFGCAILGGFLLPLVFAIFFHHTEIEEDLDASATPEDDECASCDERDAHTGVLATAQSSDLNDATDCAVATIVRKIDEDSHQDKEPCDICEEGEHVISPKKSLRVVTPINKQLCASILLGDAFHNFADGLFIGAAFKSCSSSVAVSIILVTLFHEIAQELADFILLTRYAGLSIIKACVLNFVSGLSVMLGGIVFLASDPSDEATGILLAMAGGVYVNIAACETLPRLDQIVKGRMDRVWILVSVIIGTIPIGLVLLNHQHCG